MELNVSYDVALEAARREAAARRKLAGDLYRSGLSMGEVGAEMGRISRQRVHQLLKDAGCPRRTTSATQRIKRERQAVPA